MSEIVQHLILMRHGESEGDERRAAWQRGERPPVTKTPEEERLTELGIIQSERAGRWIAKYVLGLLIPGEFDVQYVSQSLRSEETAAAMSRHLLSGAWQASELLNERNRGDVRGMHADVHRERYPESFKQMKQEPLDWTPPGGESMRSVADGVNQFLDNIQCYESVLAVTHRDRMWGAMKTIEHLSDEDWLAVDTDQIGNAYILHYTSIDPETGLAASSLRWKRLIDPTTDNGDKPWEEILECRPLSDSLEEYFLAANVSFTPPS